QFTMGDIPLGCSAYRWFNLPLARPQQPHLEAWHERLKQRPGYRKHLTLPMT
ncbi:MAG TPA: glutathione S-transferase, partial [bacterium]